MHHFLTDCDPYIDLVSICHFTDVGSIASTIMYAFYLHKTQNTDQFCTVPVINMKRADLNAHTDLQWLLDSCQIDQTNLIFVDEVFLV